jgi:hypothetical protein
MTCGPMRLRRWRLRSSRGQHFEALSDLLRLRPGSQREASFHAAQAQEDYDLSEYVVQLDESNGWTVLVEPNVSITPWPHASRGPPGPPNAHSDGGAAYGSCRDHRSCSRKARALTAIRDTRL